jgi:Predicted endonuclease containing a URI domain
MIIPAKAGISKLGIMKLWFVYMMVNKYKGVIYIGVTDDLVSRVQEHKTKVFRNSFTAKYNCDQLVYFEEFKNGNNASTREKQLKKWKRDWKIKLINDMNPSWMDISLNWGNNVNSVYKTKRFLPSQE